MGNNDKHLFSILDISGSWDMETFKVGDKVSWTSHSKGWITTKTGTIAYVLYRANHGWHKKHEIHEVVKKNFPKHKTMFTGFEIPGKAKTGYLVEVINSPKAKPRLYMPYPTKLKLIKE